jgi:hypothetical protein
VHEVKFKKKVVKAIER